MQAAAVSVVEDIANDLRKRGIRVTGKQFLTREVSIHCRRLGYRMTREAVKEFAAAVGARLHTLMISNQPTYPKEDNMYQPPTTAPTKTSLDDVDAFEWSLRREIEYHQAQLVELLENISRRATEDAKNVKAGGLPFGEAYFASQGIEIARHQTILRTTGDALRKYLNITAKKGESK